MECHKIICRIAVFFVLTVVVNSGVKNSETLTEEEVLSILSEHIQLRTNNELSQRKTVIFRPQTQLPVDWATSKFQPVNLKCGKVYSVAEERYIPFLLKSTSERCYNGFLGSKAENCTVGIFCHGRVKLAPPSEKGCEKEYMSLYDGTTGLMGGCGKFTFGKRPRTSRNGGSDIHLYHRGASPTSPCAAFCVEDLREKHAQAGILKPKRISKNPHFGGFKIDACVCGKKRDITTGRIVGGVTASKFEFPWLGFIALNSVPNLRRTVHCGVTLINDLYAISAAHCFAHSKLRAPLLDVVFHAHVVDRRIFNGLNGDDERYQSIPGWNLPNETDASENSVRVGVEELIIHPLFEKDSRSYDYDIAILKLKERVNLLDGRVTPICLPQMDNILPIPDSQLMTVVGWGYTEELSWAGARILQKLDVPFVNRETCLKYLRPSHRHICAGYLGGGKDSCAYDSGGPLVYNFNPTSDQYLLAGVVSAGAGCARKDRLGVYANVQELLPWIYFHLNDPEAKWCDGER